MMIVLGMHHGPQQIRQPTRWSISARTRSSIVKSTLAPPRWDRCAHETAACRRACRPAARSHRPRLRHQRRAARSLRKSSASARPSLHRAPYHRRKLPLDRLASPHGGSGWCHGGRLIEVLPETSPPSAPVSLLYPRNRQLSPRVRVFLDWASHEFAARNRVPGQGKTHAFPASTRPTHPCRANLAHRGQRLAAFRAAGETLRGDLQMPSAP